jgi:hypothetical protein
MNFKIVSECLELPLIIVELCFINCILFKGEKAEFFIAQIVDDCSVIANDG